MADSLVPDYDTAAAREAGVSDARIADFLATQVPDYDLAAARKAGVSDASIVNFLAPVREPVQEKPESRGTWKSDIQTGFSGTSQAMASTVAVRAAQEVEDLKKQIETFKQGDPELPAQLRHLAPQRQRQLPLLEKKLAEAEARYAAGVTEQAQDAAKLETLPVNEPAQRFTGGDLGEVLKNPGAVARGLIGQSLPAMVPLIVAVAAGGVAGGAIAGGAVGAATGGGQEAVRILAERKIDAKDPEAVKRALADPEIRAEIDRAFGVAQAIDTTVGAATGGLGGVTVPAKTTLGAVAKNVGMQAAGQGSLSAGGEAAKQGIIEGELHPGRIAAAGLSEALFAPADAASAAFHARMRPKSPLEVAKPVLDAPDTDSAIRAAADIVEGTPVDVDTMLSQAREFGGEADQQQASLNKLFGGLNKGTVEAMPDGTYQFRMEAAGKEHSVPLRVWEPGARSAEGEGQTISPELVAAQRAHYDKLGVKVVYIENDNGRIPFDGVVDPKQPDTIFLTNDLSRNAAQVGAHEVTHLLENMRLPDGTRLGDFLHQQIQEGITNEGWEHAARLFGRTAPDRSAYSNTPEGQAAHADAIVSHLIRELGADIGGEAPKFQTFAPRVVEAVEARYGLEAAKDVLQKLIAGIRETMATLRQFFSKPAEGAEYGQPETASQKWVTNLEAIHDTLAKMYAERYQSQVERERALLESQRPVREAPVEEVAPRAIQPEPLPEGTPARPESTVAAEPPAAPEVAAPRSPGPIAEQPYAEARDRAERLERWLGELDAERRLKAEASPEAQQVRVTIDTILGKVKGLEERLTKAAAERLQMARARLERLTNPEGDSQDMALVRSQLAEERQRMADAAAVGTGPAPGTARAGAAPERAQPVVTPAPVRGRAVMPEAAVERPVAPPETAPTPAPIEATPPRAAAEPAIAVPAPVAEAPQTAAATPAPVVDRSLVQHERLQAKGVETGLPTADPPADWQPAPSDLAQAKRVVKGWSPDAEMKQPQSLVNFVRKNGGLRMDTPEAAEMLASDIGRQPGLLRTRGRQADQMAQAAADAGYRLGGETRHGSGVDVDAFVTALIEDASGRRQHFPEGHDTDAYLTQQKFFQEFRNYLEDIGLQPKGMDARSVAWILQQDPSSARTLALLNRRASLGDDASLELAWRLDAEHAKAQSDAAPEPGAWDMADHRDLSSPTREELDRHHDEYQRAAGSNRADDRVDVEGRPAAEGAPAAGEPAGARRVAGEPAQAVPGTGEGRDGLEPRFSPRRSELAQTQPLIDTREAPAEELSARQRQIEKERAQLQMQGKARRSGQEAADDLPLFGGDQQKTLFSPKREEPFYSALTRGVENLKVEKAAPGQWEATLRNMPSVKAEERAWSGVDDWLRSQPKPVTKAEVLDYLRAHEVRVEEVAKGAKINAEPLNVREMERLEELRGRDMTDAERQEFRALAIRNNGGEIGDGGQPKFASYVLPGGDNYRELLLTLPPKPSAFDPAKVEIKRNLRSVTQGDTAIWYDGKKLIQYSDDPQLQPGGGYKQRPDEYWMETARKLYEQGDARNGVKSQGVDFRGGHWDEPNVLAHVRFDDRTGPKGEKVLHVAEVQSDWHQKGKKEGYAGRSPAFTPEERAEYNHLLLNSNPNDEAGQARLRELGAKEAALKRGVPDAPFKTTWPELAMKRVIRYAAENGYGRVSWDTGATNADRYDLSKHINRIEYEKDDQGRYELAVYDKQNREVHRGDEMAIDEVSDLVGKEMADKIANGEGKERPNSPYRDWRILDGLDLKVGGEGMMAFYDKQLPILANKLAKRFGSKVEDIIIGGKPRDEQGRFSTEDAAAEKFTAHSIAIAPAMRDSVLQGQPLFSPKTYTDEQRKAMARVFGEQKQTGLMEWIGENKQGLGKKFVANALDPYRPILEYSPQAYIAARNANTSTASFNAFLTEGPLKFDGDAYNLAKRNGGVENYLFRPLGDEAGDFLKWVAGNRAERLKAEDRENLFTDADIKAIKTMNQGRLDFDYTLSNGKTTRSREAAYLDSLKKLDEINRSVMELDVESGLVKRDQADALLANPYYVNFRRVAEDSGSTSFAGATSAGLTKQYAFKKLKGGTDKLNADLWQNMMGTWEHQIDAALKNKAARQILGEAEKANATRRLTAQEAAHLSDKDLKNRTVWVMEDGQKVHYAVEDPLLLRAVSALHRDELWGGPIMDGLRGFKKLLTVGVTTNPVFIAKNFIRANAHDVGIAPLSPNILKNIVTGFRANDIGGDLQNVALALGGRDLKPRNVSDSAASAMAGGGLMNFSVANDIGAQKARIALDTPDAIKKFWNYIGTTADAYRAVGGQAEQFNRIALYEKLRGEGVPHDAASFAARDLMDFTLRGPAATVRFLTDTVPFLNAWLQGTYKTGRALGNADKDLPLAGPGRKPASSVARAAGMLGAVTLGLLALDAFYADDPDYQRREEYDRNANIWFKIGDAEFRIPMGFEIAALARIAANGAEVFFDKNMTGERFQKNLLSIVGTNMHMNPIPQAFKPMLDVYANETRTGRPIENRGMERLRSEERSTINNTMAVRGLSAVLNAAARGIAGPQAEALSPVQIDYLVQAYTGWLGTQALSVADNAIRSLTSEPERPEGDLVAAVTQGMIRTSPSPQSRYVSALYDQAKAVERAYATYNDMVRQGRTADAREFFADNRDLIQKHGLVSAVTRMEGDLNRQIRIITNSPDPAMTPERKRLMIQQLQARKNRAAEQVMAPR